MSRCRTCGARLSRYRPEGSVHCAVHEPDHITHLHYVESLALQSRERLRGPDTCTKGHDLQIHGRIRNAGHGLMTRICNACATERTRAYRQRKAAA